MVGRSACNTASSKDASVTSIGLGIILLLLGWFDTVSENSIVLQSGEGEAGENQFQHTPDALPGQSAIFGQNAFLDKILGNEQANPVECGPSSHELREDGLAVPLLLNHSL
jgi:hypothetical protein